MAGINEVVAGVKENLVIVNELFVPRDDGTDSVAGINEVVIGVKENLVIVNELFVPRDDGTDSVLRERG